MDKKEVLTQLRLAKSAHIQWRAYAQALIAGLPVEQDHVPVIHTNCRFGKWYYGSGQRLASLDSYAAIDAPHEMLHQIYMKIFKLLFGDDDRSVLQKVFGSKSKLKEKNQKEIESLMQSLLSVSATLLDAIAMLEKEVIEMDEYDFEDLV